jgi:hypothetical protein
MIDVLPLRKQYEADGVPFLRWALYQPRWVSREHDWNASEHGRKMLSMTASQVFDELAPTIPDLRHIAAATRFGVTVTLGPTSRSYVAAFIWITDSTGLRVNILDHITQGVDVAASDNTPPKSRSQVIEDSALKRLSDRSTSSSCLPATKWRYQGDRARGEIGRFWGPFVGLP